MAEPRKGFFLFRPKFLLFCLYIIGYMFLRSNGEILIQQVALPSPHGVEVFRMVGANPNLPHWRQQLWRAVFSLPMVAEEEGGKVWAKGQGLIDEARGNKVVQQAGEAVRQYTSGN